LLRRSTAGTRQYSPRDSEGLVGDARALLGDQQLVLTGERVALPRKDGVVAEAAEDGVAEGEEEHLGTQTPGLLIISDLL